MLPTLALCYSPLRLDKETCCASATIVPPWLSCLYCTFVVSPCRWQVSHCSPTLSLTASHFTIGLSRSSIELARNGNFLKLTYTVIKELLSQGLRVRAQGFLFQHRITGLLRSVGFMWGPPWGWSGC